MIKNLLQSIIQFFFAEKVNGVRFSFGSLLPHIHDERDFRYESLGATAGYQPKHTVWEIPTEFVKNQGTLNTCTFNSLTAQREVTEKVELSVRSIVAYARKNGLLSGNGFSSLRNTQQIAKDFGIAENSALVNILMDWESYSSPSLLTPSVIASAALHKDKTYFSVTTKEEIFKALDDGNKIQVGTDWYSKYNMGGGLTAPWVLPWKRGVNVGGHSWALKGYDMQKQLLKCQQSFGIEWGDSGCFYIRFQDWFASGCVGYVAVDMDQQTQMSLMASYEGKQIKSANSPNIYFVQVGLKRKFPDEITFYGFGDKFNPQGTFQLVSQSVVDMFPESSPMTIQESPYWNKLKDHWDTVKVTKLPDSLSMIELLIKT